MASPLPQGRFEDDGTNNQWPASPRRLAGISIPPLRDNNEAPAREDPTRSPRGAHHTGGSMKKISVKIRKLEKLETTSLRADLGG
jgi:hypothetical protein